MILLSEASGHLAATCSSDLWRERREIDATEFYQGSGSVGKKSSVLNTEGISWRCCCCCCCAGRLGLDGFWGGGGIRESKMNHRYCLEQYRNSHTYKKPGRNWKLLSRTVWVRLHRRRQKLRYKMCRVIKVNVLIVPCQEEVKPVLCSRTSDQMIVIILRDVS